MHPSIIKGRARAILHVFVVEKRSSSAVEAKSGYTGIIISVYFCGEEMQRIWQEYVKMKEMAVRQSRQHRNK